MGLAIERTKRNGFKVKEGHKEDIFTTRVVRHWNWLLRESVAAPSLAVFKARLDGALSNLVWWKGSLHMVGGLELNEL